MMLKAMIDAVLLCPMSGVVMRLAQANPPAAISAALCTGVFVCFFGLDFLERDNPFDAELENAVALRVDEQADGKIGEIVIVGNDKTHYRAILGRSGLLAGHGFNERVLRAAEERLASSKWFGTDPETGGRPVVTAIKRDDEFRGEFLDVLVRVRH